MRGCLRVKPWITEVTASIDELIPNVEEGQIGEGKERSEGYGVKGERYKSTEGRHLALQR